MRGDSLDAVADDLEGLAALLRTGRPGGRLPAGRAGQQVRALRVAETLIAGLPTVAPSIGVRDGLLDVGPDTVADFRAVIAHLDLTPWVRACVFDNGDIGIFTAHSRVQIKGVTVEISTFARSEDERDVARKWCAELGVEITENHG